MDGPGLISVRTEVVLDVLIGSLARAVAERMADPLPGWAEAALPAAAGLVEGDPPPAEIPVGLARAGWHARLVEEERFERAREQDLLLTATLDGVEACAQLARREPLGRPDPDDEHAVTWRVPGPGGHVRHYLAERAIAALPTARQAPVLKRCWVFGFLLACVPGDPVVQAEGRW